MSAGKKKSAADGAERNADSERRAVSGSGTFGRYGAAMELDEVTHNRQPQAEAAV